jgi:hypothetical protein
LILGISPITARIQNLLEGIYGACGKGLATSKGAIEDRLEFIRKQTPCSAYAAYVMRDVYGVTDFFNRQGGDWMSARAIYDNLRLSPSWASVSGGEAIAAANAGKPVLASTEQHVSVVIPGTYVYHHKWKDFAPVISSMNANDPDPWRCLPYCYAYTMFKVAPTYWVRTK